MNKQLMKTRKDSYLSSDRIELAPLSSFEGSAETASRTFEVMVKWAEACAQKYSGHSDFFLVDTKHQDVLRSDSLDYDAPIRCSASVSYALGQELIVEVSLNQWNTTQEKFEKLQQMNFYFHLFPSLRQESFFPRLILESINDFDAHQRALVWLRSRQQSSGYINPQPILSWSVTSVEVQ